MSRLTLNFESIFHNIVAVDAMVKGHQASWTLATNVLCGNSECLGALREFGIRSVADTRISHMETFHKLPSPLEKWFMRLPEKAMASQIVEYCDVSLNSEMETIAELNAEAGRLGRRHSVILMVELGDLSEGIFSGDLLNFYREAGKFAHINVLGLGGNFGFEDGPAPSVDQLNQLAMFRELLELKFKKRLPFVSAGTSAVLPMISADGVPAAINHFRVGESVFLGVDLVNGGTLPLLLADGAILEAEVVEVKKKTLFYKKSMAAKSPFEKFQAPDYSPAERGFRAVVGIGQVDTETAGLVPVNDGFTVLGAGSDLIVVDLGPDGGGVRVGDRMQFRPSYRALMRLMASPYVEKRYLGLPDGSREKGFDLPPAINNNGLGQ